MNYTEVAPAKLNLALHVRHKRADGYHQLETLFAFVDDGDVLTVSGRDVLSLSIDGPMASGLSAGDDNLVLRAAYLLAHAAGVQPAGHMQLTKNLPVASGIGGGSADAAAALRLLNRFWGLNWSPDHLAKLAEPLGADIPACVHSSPMRGTGKGEELAKINLQDLTNAPVLLVNPMIAVATGPVFSAWDGVDRGPLGDDLSVTGLLHARNDLQPGAIRICPVIQNVITALSECKGARLVRMSGSGATCFAIFDTPYSCVRAHEFLARAHPGWWFLQTRLNHKEKPDFLPKS